MNKKIQLSAAVLGLIITTAIVAGATNAAPNWNNFKNGNVENRAAMQEALETGDYSLLGEDAKISEDQFNKILERYNENDGKMFGERQGRGRAPMGPMIDPETRETIDAALEAEDYEAWLAAVGEDCPMLEYIEDESDFAKLVEVHSLKEEARGLMEEARAIMEELGVERPMPMHGLSSQSGPVKK